MHISPEYYIDTVTGVVPTAENITVLSGDVNLSGNTGNDKNHTDVAAHLWYFNAVASCGPPKPRLTFRKPVVVLE